MRVGGSLSALSDASFGLLLLIQFPQSPVSYPELTCLTPIWLIAHSALGPSARRSSVCRLPHRPPIKKVQLLHLCYSEHHAQTSSCILRMALLCVASIQYPLSH